MNNLNQGWSMEYSWILGVIALVVIILLIILILKKRTLNQLNILTPLDVLKKRYAKGKIGKKEYLKKRIDII